MMYVELMKNFIVSIRTSLWLLDSFPPPEPKNVLLLLSKKGVRRVHEKFSPRRFERGSGCYTHFGLLSNKTFDSYFLDMIYVDFIKNFHLADSKEVMVLDSFRPTEPKNV